MAKLIQAPPKFTPPEWHTSNFIKYNNAEGQRSRSERLIDESRRLIEEVDKTTRRSQRDVNKKIDQRLEDINFWKSELAIKLSEITDEIDTLLEYKARLEKALQACDEPLAISQTCLINRESRVSIDLVHDLVEKELFKEVEVIQGVQALLKRTLEQTVEQIRLNRSAKYYLEKDLKDKAIARDIDSLCAELNNNTSGISFRANVVRIDSNSVTPHDWALFSNANIKKAEREKNSSITLRAGIDGVLKQTADDMQTQCNAVNLSFRERVAEMKDAKNKLEKHLDKVQSEISSQEKNIIELRRAIEDKNGPMMVSQSRLGERTERPNVELCRDPVQYRLIDEVNEIQTNVNNLVATLACAEAELKGLTRNQLLLEEDIQVKSNSLFIDEVQCMQIREAISINYF
ncbi:tektin-1-like [Styela clava]|uniref:tektin-1-like n=1 Tax=Styela clava TaxID=7725 RepID=UPI00193A48CE|nr:tektin-1-like [Styela clava]